MIYTAVVGSRDFVREDIRCFTSNKWFSNHRMAAKQFKVLSHLYAREPTIWLDANIVLNAGEQKAFQEFLKEADIAVFRHPFRKTVKEEFDEVHTLKIEDRGALIAFKDTYGETEMWKLPLYECNVLLRANNEAVARFNEMWWSLICRWSQRDQLTFPIALKLSGLKVAEITPLDVRKHPMFIYRQHAN